MFYFGWDISTSIVGAVVLGDDGELVDVRHFDLRKVKPVGESPTGRLLQKFDALVRDGSFGEFIDRRIEPGGVFHEHFVEERLGGFTPGLTNSQTIVALAAFNALVSRAVWARSTGLSDRHNGAVSLGHVHPSTVKSVMRKDGLVVPKGADKKAATLAYVQKRVPTFPRDVNRNGKPQPWLYDVADAYCVARSGFLRCKEKKN